MSSRKGSSRHPAPPTPGDGPDPTPVTGDEGPSGRPLPVSGSRWASSFGALRSRNYQLWFDGQSVSLAGSWMQSVAQGWVVYQLTSSQFALGAISFARTIPTVLPCDCSMASASSA